MSIVDSLTRLTTARNNIRQALQNKGVSASTHGFEDFSSDIASISTGVSGVKTGTLTVASNVSTTTNTLITNTSTIGFTPTAFLFYKDSRTATNNHVHQATYIAQPGTTTYMRTSDKYSSSTSGYTGSGVASSWTTQSTGHLYFNSNNVYFRSSSSYILSSGTWHWVAIQ